MKGNVIIGQSGGPTSVINSSIAGVIVGAKEMGCGIYGMVHGIAGFLDEKIVNLAERIKDDVDVELLKRTPAAYLGSCRYKLPAVEGNESTYEKIFEILKKNNIELFCYAGGNDSMDTVHKLSEYAKSKGITSTRFMGVPKTIDNDLAITDHCPGFGSTAKYVATSVKEVIRDGRAIMYGSDKKMVTVIEIMGRNAGWLTGAAALAKGDDCEGADLIYLPELPFDMDAFMGKVEKLIGEKNSVVVCVSEGAKLSDGKYVCELGSASDYVDAFGHKQLSGTATALANMISSKFGCKTRAIEFSTLQRAAAHISSKQDVDEAFEIGKYVVTCGINGDSGKAGILKRISDKPYAYAVGVHDVTEISNVEKKVPREWINEDGTGVTEEFVNYARPLIMGETAPIFVDGLPRHIVLPEA